MMQIRNVHFLCVVSNGVRMILKEAYTKNFAEVKRVSDRVMTVRLEIEGEVLNVVTDNVT